VLKAKFGTDLDAALLRFLPFLARTRIRPDTLTVAGVGLSLAAAAAFAWGRPFLAAIALGIGGVCDLLDGVIARHQGTSSPAGAFFDSAMDRVSDLLVLCGIAVGMARAQDVGGVVLVSWALIGSVMTSYTRARAEAHISRLSVGLMERGERVALLALGALFGLVKPALWVIAIGATITTVQRFLAARRLLRELDRTGRDPTLKTEPVTEV
jgi:phosphatidylglycerophosphate synthase